VSRTSISGTHFIERIQGSLDRLSTPAVVLSSCVALVLIGIGDYITGVEIIFTMFYLIPVSAITWKLGRAPGIVASLICAVAWSIVDYFGRPLFDPVTVVWNIAIQFAMFVSYAVVLSRVRTGIDAQNAVNEDLEAALAEVKRLSGVLPICAWCKKIRDSEGVWHQLEAYILDHSEADFTHSICPECRHTLYPRPGKTGPFQRVPGF
jgi:K+-sensing histidine kinase KdpD